MPSSQFLLEHRQMIPAISSILWADNLRNRDQSQIRVQEPRTRYGEPNITPFLNSLEFRTVWRSAS